MNNVNKPDAPQPATAAVPQSTSASARKAWTINFKAPLPCAMPGDRLRARADLVRAAMQCGSTC